MTREYFYARIWAVPAGIMLFGFNGWYTGMQNALFPMCTAITVNVLHTLCSLWFAFRSGHGHRGHRLRLGHRPMDRRAARLGAARREIPPYHPTDRLVEVLDLRPLKTYFIINRDIILRTFCIVAVYTFFTGSSAGWATRSCWP